MYDEIEIGTILTCYRIFDCDYMPDDSLTCFEPRGCYRLKPEYIYRIKGCGSLFMSHGIINTYTGEEYTPHENEAGFSIEVYTWNYKENKYKNHLFYFSTDPKSPIFYGKWFFDDIHYREIKILTLLHEN